jgi:hypothetical protein
MVDLRKCMKEACPVSTAAPHGPERTQHCVEKREGTEEISGEGTGEISGGGTKVSSEADRWI